MVSDKVATTTRFEKSPGFTQASALGTFVQKAEGKLVTGVIQSDGSAVTTLVTDVPDLRGKMVELIRGSEEGKVTTIRIDPQSFAWAMYFGTVNPALIIFTRQDMVVLSDPVRLEEGIYVWVETSSEELLIRQTGSGYFDGVALFDDRGKRLL